MKSGRRRPTSLAFVVVVAAAAAAPAGGVVEAFAVSQPSSSVRSAAAAAAFAPPSHRRSSPTSVAPTAARGWGSRSASSSPRTTSTSTTRAYLFRDLLKKVRGDGDDGGDDENETKKEADAGAKKSKADEEEEADGSPKASKPFFARFTDKEEEEETSDAKPSEAEQAVTAPPASSANYLDSLSAATEGEEKQLDEEVDPATILAASAAVAATAASVAKEEPTTTAAEPAAAPEAESSEPKKDDPLEEARKLRLAAQKARLEAEKMDAQLTLDKISKLEKELGSIGNVKEDKAGAERAREISLQLESLNLKLRGEDPASLAERRMKEEKEKEAKKGKEKEEGGEAAASSTLSPLYSRDSTTGETTLNVGTKSEEDSGVVIEIPGTEPLTPDQIAERVALFEKSPDFLKVLTATVAGLEDVKSPSDINATALILKLHDDDVTFKKNQAEVERENLEGLKRAIEKSGGEVTILGLDEDGKETPVFTKDQIDAKVKELEAVPQFVKNLFPDEVAKNDTALAIKMLTDDWENEQMAKSFWGGGDNNKDTKNADVGRNDMGGGTGSLFDFDAPDLGSETDRMVRSLYPKQMTDREGTEVEDRVAAGPTDVTDKVMKVIMEDVLTKLRLFSPSGQPEKVPGGYIVRGVNSYDDGKALIDAIDAQIAKSPRADGKVLIHYVSDPTPVTEEQLALGDRDPVLLVTVPNLRRETNSFLLAGVTAVAVGTSWYAALYPFLVNPAVLSRAEEQLDLANAGMEYNLNWLTDQAVPLYAAFALSIAAHELAHRVVAGAYGMNVTVPTLVPSLVTGVTGQITAFKDPPRDRQQLLDFALAGPLVGMAVSAAFLGVGCGLTAGADAATYGGFPALPVDVLRQSSLGGGIIEAALGNGVLSVPMNGAASRAVADITISLHPLAIAGYFGLLVNACALLPFGRTDGGRIALSLFGRSGTQLVGLISLVCLFFAGLMGSDVLLFYFSFVAFFQGELEVPCRNEVDEVDFSRVLAATAGGVIMLLTLIPMV